MDLDFEIKQLAEKLGVSGQALINLEMNLNQPRTSFLKWQKTVWESSIILKDE